MGEALLRIGGRVARHWRGMAVCLSLWQGHAKGRRALARPCRCLPLARRRLPRTIVRVARQRLTEGLMLSWQCQESSRAGRFVCRLLGHCLFANLFENLSSVTLQGHRPASYARQGVKTSPYKVDGGASVSSPRHSTTRHQGTAVYFIRTVVYTLPAVARWPTPLHGNKAEVFDEILNEASVVPWQGHAKGRRALARPCRRLPSTRRRLPRTTVQVARQRLAEELRLSWLCRENRRACCFVCCLLGHGLFASTRWLFDAPQASLSASMIGFSFKISSKTADLQPCKKVGQRATPGKV